MNEHGEIGNKLTAPTAQSERLMTEVHTAVKESVIRINEFMSTKWAAYRKLVERMPVKLFKDKEIEGGKESRCRVQRLFYSIIIVLQSSS